MDADINTSDVENNISFKILNDEVTDNDAFGAHQKVANAISSLILSNDYGKSIGLIGNWGSGKSSIIKMIEKKLKNSCEVFIFDAWAHEGDPMKRSFLEKLMTSLKVTKWLANEKWIEDKQKELSRKKETTIVTTNRFPKIRSILFILFVLLSSVGIEALKNIIYLRQNNIHPFLQTFNIDIAIIVILAASPVLLILYSLFQYYDSFKKNKSGNERYEYISFVKTDFSETVTSDSFKSIDPTSIEFKNIFKEIFDKIENDGQKKFLIVVDNLDRIDEEDALKIWATMKTFFETDGICDKWKKKLWLLVPYDKNALDNLWKDKLGGNGQKGILATSFIEKTFQANFETPLPMLKDWEKYFKDKFKEAFLNYNDNDEIHKIFRIFDLEGRADNKPPTPREIKIFINNLGASYLVNNEDIPLHLQALYTIKRKDEWKDDNDFLKNLKKPKGENIFKSPEYKLFLAEDYRIKLASLFFKVEENRARALLLEEDIKKAINDENEAVYKKLFDIPGVGLETERIVEGEYKSNNIFDDNENDKLLIIYRNISSIGSTEGCIKNSLNIIKSRVEQVKNWDSFNDKMADGLVRLLKNHQKNLKYDNIFTALGKLNYLVEEIKEEGKSFYNLNNVDILNRSILGINSVLRSIQEIDKGNDNTKLVNILENNFKIVIGNSNTYNHFIAFLTNNYSNEEVIKYYLSNLPVKDISDSLIGIIKEGKNIQPNIFKVIEFYHKISLGVDWAVLTRVAIAKQKTLLIKDHEYDAISMILLSMTKLNIISQNDIASYAKSLEIFECFSLYIERKDVEAVFPIFTLLTIYNNDDSVTNPSENATKGKNYYDKIIKDCDIEFINKYADYIINNNVAQFIITIRHKHLDEFIKKLMNTVFKRSDATKLFENEFIYNNEAVLYDDLGNELYVEFFKNTEKEKRLSKFTVDKSFDVKKASMYKIILCENENNDTVFINYIKRGLENTTTENWKKELVAGYENIYDVLICTKDVKIRINLTSPFEQAINELLIEAKSNQEIKEKLKYYWSAIISSFEEGTLKVFKQNLRDYFIDTKENSIEQILDIIGLDFIDIEILIEKIDDILRRLAKEILNRNIVMELKWLNYLFEKGKEIIEKKPISYKYIKDIIAKKDIKSLEENARNEYTRLDETLGIKRKKEETRVEKEEEKVENEGI